ncbi:membrane-bound PQQ-dependent dehydrogenase, glucose/quinate/shikimate family [Uliginosibacterium paludis]|uniref:Membrane-bound PQQ-dependent dehydrogenase, glucose/quinate/shikimate family n=1 Tax=Uliginosibacterium paludis TaxID=1615952 RepID=A0ABV2CP78_9RHOO
MADAAQGGSDPEDRHIVALATGSFVGALGLYMSIAGGWLAVSGGSLYYLIGGLMLMACGVMLARRHPAATPLYAAFLAATLVWALYEVGLDWWQLTPRVPLWFVIGGWLLLPGVCRALGTRPSRTLALVMILCVGTGLATLAANPHEVAGKWDGPYTPAPSGLAMAGADWPDYGGTSAGQRFSTLDQITPANVADLELAWHFRTGDAKNGGDPNETTDENTPIKIGNTLYACTPHSILIALDATEGTERWRFDPKIQSPVGFRHFAHMTCRGVSYHADPVAVSNNRPCASRIFLPTADARLMAVDARSGKVCEGFGDHGQIDLRRGIGAFKPGGYYSTSPPAVVGNVVVMGAHVTDNSSNDEPSGVIRAFDAKDGHELWYWDAGRPEDNSPLKPGERYLRNSPNMWSIMSADPALNLVYLPMGNQTPDQWGGERTPGAEMVSAGVVALDVRSGRMVWHYQFTHHDLWDMDVGGQPSLVDLQTPQGLRPALIASTKQGSIYVLDRRDGTPIFPVAEVPVPQGTVPDDHLSPTQPMSAVHFRPEPLTEASMWGATALDQLWCRLRFRSLRYEGPYTPPSLQGSIVYPGNFGVFDWGGVSIDPLRQLAIVSPAYMAFYSRLIPKGSDDGRREAVSEREGEQRVDGIPYDFDMGPLLSPLGLPCQAPPWGYVAAVDLRSGKTLWQHRNGTVRDNSPLPLPFRMGVPALGGMVSTAGGVSFLSGTLDQYLRAYDVATGTERFRARLPAGGQATPMTYQDARGRQLVVVVAGGHGSLGTKTGDHIMAWALPKEPGQPAR